MPRSHRPGENIVLIAVYVDDVLIASKDVKSMQKVSDHISQHFDIRDLGEVQQCLGIDFRRDGNVIELSQSGYVDEMLNRFGMENCNPVSSPLDQNPKLNREVEESSKDEADLPYRELLGCLTYLATCTRPDISYAVSYLGQFNNCFGEPHWKAAKRILRYLKGTKDVGLVYRPDSKPLVGYVDSDWGNCHLDRRSHSGFIFLLSGCAVTWDSKKQKTVALSSCEAEYMALTKGAKAAVFLQRFLIE